MQEGKGQGQEKEEKVIELSQFDELITLILDLI